MLADIAKGITSLQSQFVSQGAQFQSLQENLPCQIHSALTEALDGFKDSVLDAVDDGGSLRVSLGEFFEQRLPRILLITSKATMTPSVLAF